MESLSISNNSSRRNSHSDDDEVFFPTDQVDGFGSASDANIQLQCYLRFNRFPGAELSKREALYLHYNVIYLRMTQALAELSDKTGMPITQENGQRRYGPPTDYNGPPVQKGSEIFVGKLPRDLYEAELVPVFERAGKIFELRLMMDFSGTNRGYCFVQYYTSEDASNAIKILNEFEIRPGRFIGVVKSVDNCRLFVGGIPRDKTKEDILEEIRKITEGVIRVIANPSPMDRTKNRGYAFIEYENHRAAAMARRKMIPGKIMMWGINVAVDWAEPEPDVMNLYVRNVTSTTTEEDLHEIFNLHSQNGVEKVKKIKDYAFIHFLSRAQAEEALNTLDGTEIDGSVLEITWAKPVNKVIYKARKALAKQLYSHGGNGNNNTKGNYDAGTSSDRIFGQYNSLSCYNTQNQMIYQQIPQQSFHHGGDGHAGNFQSFHYQHRPLVHDPLTPPVVGCQSFQYQNVPLIREPLTPPRPIQPFQFQNGPGIHEPLTPPVTCFLFHPY